MKKRFYPLDIFRGSTVAFMILVNNPGSWSFVYPPLGHAQWHGYTPTDLVFPFFLFAVGNALAFVLPKLREQGQTAFWQKTVKRTLLIFMIGVLLNWFPFIQYDAAGNLVGKPFENLRFLGVLQRIALCYFFASLLTFYFRSRTVFFFSLGLLVAYWLFCFSWGGSDPYALEGWFGLKIDRWLLGENHLYKGEGVPFDPEGIASTLPAIVQVTAGYLVGEYIIRNQAAFNNLDKDVSRHLLTLVLAAAICAAAGLLWSLFFPLNKKIWTSSFVLLSTGWAIALLTLIIYLTEIKNWRAWGHFFDVFGKNPLFVFVLSGVMTRLYGLFRIPDSENGQTVYKGLGKWSYDHLFAPVFGDMNGSLIYAVAHVLLLFAIAWWLDRKRVYIRL